MTSVNDRRIYLLIIGSIIIGYADVFLVFGILRAFGVILKPGASAPFVDITTSSLPFRLIFMALIEEIIFRLPLAVAVEARVRKITILRLAVYLSMVFGALHGGFLCIFIQGFGGFMYCVLFLKCGGYRGNYRQGLAVSTTAHFLWNLSVSFLSIYYGATAI